ncbi:Metallo-hydrolase/oxidoreductase [Punctularia strigosozonata HHB-11173 SS5]|uniref:Metallo-hydrolase/oxidoreductase n=1 Tax=Punctularia strigosozonata (strain HHB-11173) TaxID=741275 RepID=UPI0004417F5E|nr:Metallo-hydrolase/oxidoreductase [Punctularia strigosozonata HHB-11173 SS5]EIN12610.1 Metallo-hydrolase/oxidoreductase [Punctularia strigosozonata HHB-11173 SS5]
MTLPLPAKDQPFFRVSALEAGMLQLPLELILAGYKDPIDVPSLSFLLRHSSSGKTVVFDLGIRRDLEAYPPLPYEGIKKHWVPTVQQSVAESLQIGGIEPSDVNYVIISHLHWDHAGDPRPFTNATFIVGADSCHMTESNTEDVNAVPASGLPQDRTRFEGRETWQPLGPFPLALDVFGDGSAYLVDAQGHCHGHTNLLVRTSADGAWIYFAGDSAHDRRLLTGEASMAIRTNEDGSVKAIMHKDMDKAKAHIQRIAALEKKDRVRVLLAHDREWYATNKGGPAFWPGEIPSL